MSTAFMKQALKKFSVLTRKLGAGHFTDADMKTHGDILWFVTKRGTAKDRAKAKRMIERAILIARHGRAKRRTTKNRRRTSRR